MVVMDRPGQVMEVLRAVLVIKVQEVNRVLQVQQDKQVLVEWVPVEPVVPEVRLEVLPQYGQMVVLRAMEVHPEAGQV
jgi:hypothetical protein